jgi:hypothetical protein
VRSHVVIHVLLAPDSFLTICTFVDVLRTLNLQIKAVCFLILVLAFMSLYHGGKDDILTVSNRLRAGVSRDGLILHLEWARHVHSYSFDLEW